MSDYGQSGAPGEPPDKSGKGGDGGKGGEGGDGRRGKAGGHGGEGGRGGRAPEGPGEANESLGAQREDPTWFDSILHRIAPDLTRLRRIVAVNLLMWVILGTAGLIQIGRVNENTSLGREATMNVESSICAVNDYAEKQARNIRELAAAANPETRAIREKQAVELESLAKDIRAPGVMCAEGPPRRPTGPSSPTGATGP